MIVVLVQGPWVQVRGDEVSVALPPEVRDLLEPSAIFLAHAYDLADENGPAWDILRVVRDARFQTELRQFFQELGSAGGDEQFTDFNHGLFQIARSYEESPSLAAFGPASYSYVMANRGFPTDAEGTSAALASAIRGWTVANTAIVEGNLKTVLKGLSELIEADPERAAQRIADAVAARQAVMRRPNQQTGAFVAKYFRLKTAFEKTLYEWPEAGPAALGSAIHPLLIQVLSESKARLGRSAAEKERSRRIAAAIASIERNGIRLEQTSNTGGNTPGPGVVTSSAAGSVASADAGYCQQLSRIAHLYLMCWGDSLADLLGVTQTDVRGALGGLHQFNLSVAAKIVAFRAEFLDEIQDESGQPLLEIDEISWREDDETKEEDFCGSLYPKAGETTERGDYQEWIKELICDYIKADFSDKAARTGYVEQVLAALRKNNRGRAWTVKGEQTVSHIVTQDPVALVPTGSTLKVETIDSAAVQRSRFDPDTAATGFHQNLFVKPKAKKAAEAEARIPDAEQLIQFIFALKVVADLISDSPDALSREQVNAKLSGQQKAFRDEMLKIAKPVLSKGEKIDAKPAATQTSTPDIDTAHNRKTYEPSDGTIPITSIKDGDMLGLTLAQYGIRSKVGATPDPIRLNTLERIVEKAMAEGSGQHVVIVALRTLFISHVSYGAVRDKKVLQVVSKTGEPCTEKIKAHENSHMEDQWQAWKQNVIDAMETDLKTQTFSDGMAYSQTRAVKPVKLAGEITQVADIIYAVFFPKDKKRAAEAADEELKKRYGESALDAFIQRFNEEREKGGEAFHKEEYALNDDCQFVGKDKGGKAVGTPKSEKGRPEEPSVDTSELRPK